MNTRTLTTQLLLRFSLGTLMTVGALSLTGCSGKATTSRAVVAEGPTTFEGAVDYATANFISGWAWDKTKPDQPIEVDIFDGTTRLGTVMADMLREDLKAKGRGNGRHGFEFPTPATLKDGKSHTIHVRVKGTDFELHDSPKPLKN